MCHVSDMIKHMKLKTCYGIAAVTLGAVYLTKHGVNAKQCNLYHHCKCSQFVGWSREWFKNVDQPAPVFKCSGEQIKVLTHPADFYNTLKDLSGKAKRRVTLASLYLGTGDKEQKLVETLYKNLSSNAINENKLKLSVLLEHTRGSRGTKNSRTLLLPLVADFPHNTNVALFHTPNLRGLLRGLLPERFNETINVAHLKVYLFDDTLIMSGANLSDDYFTNRQDRYVIFEDCPELCDYFDELVETISKFSFQLLADNSTRLHHEFPYHPYEGSKKLFNKHAGKLISDFMKKYTKNNTFQSAILNDINNAESSECKQPTFDTLVFPLLQMRSMGIMQDEQVTRNILASTPLGIDLRLATAYFNLTDNYWNALMSTRGHVELLMAHPKAMGFYKAPGMAGGIPNAYSLISNRRFKDLIRKNHQDRIRFQEFHRPGWTFHGKGLWASYECNDSERDTAWLLTLIGSPNFGKRSVYRDMESQIAIVTTNSKLKAKLLGERDNMWKDSTSVSRDTYNNGSEERNIKWWVWGIATFLNQLF